ncbi:MAG: TetR/AcrR family transcriptional regulator [Paracoccaceae bacterium]
MVRQLKDDIDQLKKDRIVEAAEQMFFAQGFTQTSMSQIAEALAVGKPLIYHFFSSKTELLAEVCNRTTEFAATLADTSLKQQGSACERLRSIVRELSLQVMANRAGMSVLFREAKHLPEAERIRLARNYHHFNKSLNQLLSDGVASGEFRFDSHVVVTHAISGMSTWLFTWYDPGGALSAEEIASELETLAVRMLVSETPDKACPE